MAKPKKSPKSTAAPAAVSPKPSAKDAAKPAATAVVAAAAVTPVVAAPSAAAPVKAKRKPTREEIGARAHALWISEGKPEGKSVEHWVRAERELGA